MPPLVFMMGRSPAFLPTDRHYARNHMWAAEVVGGFRFGFSAYAVKLFGEVHHLDWSTPEGAAVQPGDAIGTIEGSKATSDLYAPAGGTIVRLNPAVPDEPILVNTNSYDSGWLLEMATARAELLAAEEYVAYLETCWPLAQRLLKGQAGRRDGPQV